MKRPTTKMVCPTPRAPQRPVPEEEPPTPRFVASERMKRWGSEPQVEALAVTRVLMAMPKPSVDLPFSPKGRTSMSLLWLVS